MGDQLIRGNNSSEYDKLPSKLKEDIGVLLTRAEQGLQNEFIYNLMKL